MTCEYFSRVNGKVFCRIYGAFEATQDKIRECQSDPHYCFEKANQFLKEETRRDTSHRRMETYTLAGIFNRTGFRI